MNVVCIKIDNCCDCPNHCEEKIYTADPWDHEMGVFCTKVPDKNSPNKKDKLVAEDDWNVRRWSQVPDWCPILKKNQN